MAAGTRSTAELHRHVLAGACASALLASSALAVAAEAPQVTWLDRIEVTATPIPGTTIDAAQLPYMVQSATNSELSRARSNNCLLYTSPSPRDRQKSRMPSSA